MSLINVQGYMLLHLPPLLKVVDAIDILLLLVIGFNPYNIYSLLYRDPTYGDSYFFPYLGYLIRAFIRILVFVRFFSHTSNFSCNL